METYLIAATTCLDGLRRALVLFETCLDLRVVVVALPGERLHTWTRELVQGVRS